MEIGIVFLVFAFVFLLFAGPFIFILFLVKMLRGGSRNGGTKWTAEETKAIQEIHRGLRGMEKRIESLETILFDRAGSSGELPEALDRREPR